MFLLDCHHFCNITSRFSAKHCVIISQIFQILPYVLCNKGERFPFCWHAAAIMSVCVCVCRESELSLIADTLCKQRTEPGPKGEKLSYSLNTGCHWTRLTLQQGNLQRKWSSLCSALFRNLIVAGRLGGFIFVCFSCQEPPRDITEPGYF